MRTPWVPRNAGAGEGARPVVDPEIESLDRLARLLDSHWRIPFTRIGFGFDALLGLLPVAGDMASALVSFYIVARAWRHGASGVLIAHMLANVVLDTVAGSVPILGSVFDVAYRANIRNVGLLRDHLQRQRASS